MAQRRTQQCQGSLMQHMGSCKAIRNVMLGVIAPSIWPAATAPSGQSDAWPIQCIKQGRGWLQVRTGVSATHLPKCEEIPASRRLTGKSHCCLRPAGYLGLCMRQSFCWALLAREVACQHAQNCFRICGCTRLAQWAAHYENWKYCQSTSKLSV